MTKTIDYHCIEQLKSGSQRAFNQLYDAYAGRMYGFCYQYTKSHEDSEELVHDLFVQIWNKRELLREDLPVIHLLYHMMRNSLINRFHARVQSPSYELYTDYLNYSGFSVDDSSMQIEYDDFCRHLNQLKQELNDTQQQIVEQKIHGGLTIDQIAEVLHLSKQTVKNQLSLALKQLRQRLLSSDLLLWMGVLLY